MFHLNSFYNSVRVVGGVNRWNSLAPISYAYNSNSYTNYLGNYYKGYSGIDADGDGIGDIPYEISGDSDNYPLIMPFEDYEVSSGSGAVPFEQRLVIFQNHNEIQSGFRFNGSTLQYGTLHPDIEILQIVLKHEGFFPIGTPCTGGYFQITMDSVASFQQDRALSENDGIIGDETIVELNKILDTKCTIDTSRASLISEYVRQYCHTFLPDYFPPELVLAIAAQESGGVYFDNMYVSEDCGRGIMQITSEDYFRTGSGVECTDTDSVHCGPTKCESYYKNTVCGIEANIKDGLYALADKYKLYAPDCPGDGLIRDGLEFSCEDIQKIMTVWGYNGIAFDRHYFRLVGDKLDNLSAYFPGESYNDTDNLIQKLRLADNNKEEIWVYSPVLLSVTDPIGQTTGMVGGEIQVEIPASIYDSDNEAVIVFLPEGSLRYRVVGKSEGVYGLSIESTISGTSMFFRANDIPTSPSAIHEYAIDWDILSQDEKGAKVKIDAEGDGSFERSITADRELTADEFNGVPVANAGPDETVESTSHEGAVVTLDGSGSMDPDSTPGTNDDILHFDWWEEGNPLWSGEIIDYLFPIGNHTVSLYVTDRSGLTDSDDVIITVVEPQTLESQLWITPTVINRNVGGGQITAKLSLPDGIGKDQIDLDQPLLLYPGEIEAIRQHTSQRGSRSKSKTTIFAFFGKRELLDAVLDDGQIVLEVVGQLKTGQWFSGSDDIKIATPKKASKKTTKRRN
ncbi:MAG: hypothetical protein A2Z25_23215 [Planctomycetes bacterium RBG_16_55_9]|nr:MAG: hypothetical protein A2Z25_23215 [Planctomycetes bacterium RBG_16_55_9]